MSLVVRQKCLTLQDQLQNKLLASVRRRTEDNEALSASLSPANSCLHRMLSSQPPSKLWAGRRICRMPTKLPLFMRNIFTLSTPKCKNAQIFTLFRQRFEQSQYWGQFVIEKKTIILQFLPQQASNYASTSNCTYNQAKGIFFLVRNTKSSKNFLNLVSSK